MLTDGLYGAIIDNPVRELACIVVKLRQRDIQFAGDILQASAAQGGKKTAEIMQSYMNAIYTENQQYMDTRDDDMKQELKQVSEIEWKDVLSVTRMGMEMKKGRVMPKEGETIEEIL